MNTRRDFRYEPIHEDELTATDLTQIVGCAIDDGAYRTISAYRIWIDGEPEPAQALVIDWDEDDEEVHIDYREHRIGIAWGADATWGDLFVESDPITADLVTRAIDVWLNDAEAWQARN